MSTLTLCLVAGVRSECVKLAALAPVLDREPDMDWLWVHTGQHCDKSVSGGIIGSLGLPAPQFSLPAARGAGAARLGEMIALCASLFDYLCKARGIHAVVVFGDTDATHAAAAAANKFGLPVVHVEAGLRSGDRSMPEEINRIIVDHISDLLLCSEESGVDNLAREGVPAAYVRHTGNVMIDAMRLCLPNIREKLGFPFPPGSYALTTLHRPANIDDPEAFGRILDALDVIAESYPAVWPVHPRVAHIPRMRRYLTMPPQNYLDFLALLRNAHVVLTDSGGVQEEATAMKVPCVTLCDATERAATIRYGTNRLGGTTKDGILAAFTRRAEAMARACMPPLWDGHAAERCVREIVNNVQR